MGFVASASAQEPVAVRAVAFSPDGRLLATGTGLREQPGLLTVWDTPGRRVLWKHPEAKGVCSVAFSPDGATLAIAFFAPVARLLDAATGKVKATVGRHDKEVRGVAFSPDGRTLATASYDHTVKLWNVADGTAKQVLRGHTDMVFTVAFSPDGTLLLSAGGGDAMRLWDLATGKEKFVWRHGNFYNRCAIFTHDGRWALTGGYEGTVRLWDVADGRLRAKFTNIGGVDGLAYSEAAHLLAVCSNGRDVHLFGLDLRQPSDEERRHIAALLARFDDDSYEVREAAGRELLAIGFVAEADLARAARESPSAEVRIRARRLRQDLLGKPEVLHGHTDNVGAVAFSPDGRTLASGGSDGVVILWDVAARKEIARLTPPVGK
jgi:WD40 repeat protein